ncbi:MAG: methyl-accepting chemotaxis protein [Clostridia bacterium]|nr:methyl-accepting chemotaxis protein [Clostridia bacterium]
MFNHLKLSFKIGAGFGAVLLIATLLGVFSVVNMGAATNKSGKLTNEYIPEVTVLNETEISSLATMYEMRGYALSGENSYLDRGRKYLTDVKKYIQDAKLLSDKYADLVKLKEDVGTLESKVNEYEALVNETVLKNDSIKNGRKLMDAASEKFIQNIDRYIHDQYKYMAEEINSGADKGKLTERLKKIDLSNDVIDLGNVISVDAQKAQALRDPQIIRDTFKNFDAMDALLTEIRKITVSEVNIKQLEEVKSALDSYKKEMNELLANWTALQELNTKRGTAGEAVITMAKEIMGTGLNNTTKVSDETSSSLALSNNVMVVGLIIALLFGIFLAILIIRSITRPVDRIVKGLNEGADQVASASEQLSVSSQQLAEASSEQAASIEETSATLEESQSMVQQNNENTKQAALLAGQAKAAADLGNSQMQHMLLSINEIKKSSDQISKIIKVIDEIAFQTNILALNAAVEAARAGDAGMGFAVVAEEVRNLAQRSAQAAKDTAAMIENNIDLSDKGVDAARRVSESLSEITVQAKKVNELMEEIAAASQEQAQGISQINKAIVQMEKVTQQNAATSEESAAASEELSAQAETMKEMVGELIRLVNGSGDSRNVTTGSLRKNRISYHEALPERGDKSLSKRLNLPVKNTLHKGSKIVSPDEVIPLELDRDDF